MTAVTDVAALLIAAASRTEPRGRALNIAFLFKPRDTAAAGAVAFIDIRRDTLIVAVTFAQ